MNVPALALLAIPLLLVLYVWLNDAKLEQLPTEAARISPERWTKEKIELCYAGLKDGPISVLDEKLPPRTGRRYIVVGGAGFLGGWIVLHLLQRGEDPRRIRVLDIRLPVRQDLQEGRAREVDFIKVDVSDRDAVFKAFNKRWPKVASDIPGAPDPEVTVFHTASVIRFFERHPDLLYLSENVNVHGTQNILDAARDVGVRIIIYTSSGSVGVRRSCFWLLPWQKEPKHFTQVINDDDSNLPKRHDQFFSNYAVSKLAAERRVRAADRSESNDGKVLRTGCIRPGNGVFGPGGDLLVGAYMVRKYNPTWLHAIMQSYTYVENCSLAHLLYEQRLIELENGSTHPDIGGDAFCIADMGPPPTSGDIHFATEVLSGGKVRYHNLSPTAMLGVAQLVELYYLGRRFLIKSRFAFLGSLLPQLLGEIVFLQPSMFALTNVHLYFDDSRARAPPEKGGLGYTNHYTTLEGVCRVVADHYRTGGQGTTRAIAGHVETSQSPLVGAELAIGTAMEKIGDPFDARKALN
ncbi:uncharacterized protein PHACADRAFT_207796 [Phanerochaete carnosa HHB-10118-sp]|uniref:3-beta hydroxysteroid dehydrogenase/isomerase domain-containing protein n=1 Tax=Phanerochaete carnosa (strain HHB-10118-sp) TaxID=650164 RepID=K5VYC5_PHACS|nr:uncharacterized protein PHACADRAFT_207796 [Phanerochaete carnosa HHB-10118-sp]EKM56588.1 hypothetical protein PHACADRAFT_207796 [Phanerochaete carnosa HHB-10118-sp]